MKFCRHCGSEMMDAAVVCTKCGCPVVKEKKVSDPGLSGAEKVVSFLVPIIGIILWLVNRNSKPVSSKEALDCAIGGFFINIALILIISMFSCMSY